MFARAVIKLQSKRTMVVFPEALIKPQRNVTWSNYHLGTPPLGACRTSCAPFYAAVNRLHQLEAKSGASPAEIAAARHAVGVAAVQLVRHVDGLGCSKRTEQLCTTSGERDARLATGIAELLRRALR